MITVSEQEGVRASAGVRSQELRSANAGSEKWERGRRTPEWVHGQGGVAEGGSDKEGGLASKLRGVIRKGTSPVTTREDT